MPILAMPGVMMPGQFGPISRLFGNFVASTFAVRTMSSTGTPSVIATINVIPAAAASRIASPQPPGGTKISEQLAPVLRTASSTESKTGKPSTSVPPLPGVTPPKNGVP